jgi:phage FluMu protein Com
MSVRVRPNIVQPAEASGMNMDPLYLATLGLWRRGPKWTIRCGSCALRFEARLPMLDQPAIPCPFCKSVNVIDIHWSDQ